MGALSQWRNRIDPVDLDHSDADGANLKWTGNTATYAHHANKFKGRWKNMQINIAPEPVVSLIAGILILIFPRLLNYIVAFYLIIFGILGLIR